MLIQGVFSVETSWLYCVSSRISRRYTSFLVTLIIDKLEGPTANGVLLKGEVGQLSLWQRRRLESYSIFRKAISYLLMTITGLFYFIASYLKPTPHRPYDFIYRSLPPIQRFSHLSI